MLHNIPVLYFCQKDVHMDWGQVLSIVAVNVGLIFWIRQDSRDFMNRIETWKDEINKEMKDFHARLAVIEERKK